MSLRWLRLKFGDQGTFSVPYKNEYIRKYDACSNNRFDTALTISRDPLCPQRGDVDSEDINALVTNVVATRNDRSYYFWEVTITSSTDIQPDEDPLKAPTKYTLNSEQYTRQTWKNRQGKYIVNTARDLLPMEMEDTRWVLDGEKNLKSIPTYILNMNNRVNRSAVFLKGLILPKGTVMIKGIRGEEQSVRQAIAGKDLEYVTMHFQLHYRPEGWKVTAPNVGLRELVRRPVPSYSLNAQGLIAVDRDSNGNIKYRLTDELIQVPIRRGSPPEKVTEAWPLDKKGKALPDGYKLQDLIDISEDIYFEADFTQFPLR